MSRTYYDVLGVPEDADADAIRAAYRERVKETHPDQSDDPDAGDRFRRVREAKEVLTDRSERRRYDRLGHERYVGDGARGTDGGPTREWTHRPTGGTATGHRRRQRARRKWAEAQREAQRESRDDGNRTGSSEDGTGSEASTGATAGGPTGASEASGATAASETSGPTGTDAARGPTGRGGATAAGTAAGAGATTASRDAVGYRVRRGSQPGPRYTPAKVGLAAVTFLLYPVLVASAVLPAFPLVVNVVVGVCTLLLVTYLLSVPEVAVLVFGGWTLLAPALLTVTGVGVVTPAGFFIWAACWLPCALAVANFVFLSA